MNIVDLIFERSTAAHPAVVSPELQLTFGELQSRMNACAQRMNADPAWPGKIRPRIGLGAPNGADYIVLALAILKQNACFVPIPAELTASERAQLAKSTALDVIVFAKNAEDWRIEAVTHDSPPAFDESALEALNPAFIRFSSGTTGTSKGIVISHETLLGRITAANEGLRIGPQDRVLWVLPMAHHFAVSIILYLYHGATTILAPASDPKVMLAMMREHEATVMYGSPYHYTMLSGQPDAAVLGSLRLAVSTAFALTNEVADLFASKTGLHLTQGMGIIEAGLPILNLEHAKDKPTSIGKPLPAFEIKLDDGELLLRGPGVFDAYLAPWQPREAILRDGWFATGDIAEVDEDGCLYLRGRVRSVINVGGLKCFPEEVEAVLRGHPGVKAVRITARAHPALGAMPVAEIIAVDAEAPPPVIELRKLCQERLSAYKVPLFYTFVSELPLTASGKLRRY
ncbi:class I adenylate-forming enzyme family protein [Prosthecobacter sp.]|uniref:class I adenylate-forming enzyme family protein n=1 Tax=Prosthecobacter sp. TaxID=1965333 RepID=UPI002ABAA519|nr:class I adenylate-forming enzyme family protein [Prosthecobacter sp.]MDZ4403763.1 class I adenylate-forming enzyme family protein [Prosthecobacter sp.]